MRFLKIFVAINLMALLPLLCMISAQQSSKKMLKQKHLPRYDVIVVPGIPFEEKDGNWGMLMKHRVLWAVYLYNKGVAKNIMFSGSAVHTPYIESKVMAAYAEVLGVPKEHLFMESKAEHSTENIYYSYRKAHRLGFKKIALTTDPFQNMMLNRFIKARNLEVDRLPILYKVVKKMEANQLNPTIDYQVAFVQDFVAVKEKESFRERFRGTLGKRIDTTAYSVEIPISD